MRAIWALLLVLLLPALAGAQIGTEPLAWQPQHRHTADLLGTVAVYGQVGADTLTAFRSPDRKSALLREGCRLGLAVGVSQGLKWAIPEWRPNGVDQQSFPSMHSAVAAASSGWRYEFGVPIAAFVGLSRANANWHHLWPDVAAGWAIGALAQAVCR